MIDKDLIHEDWITNLSEEARFDVTSIATKRSYSANEFLFRKGDKPEAFYGIISGRVRVSSTTYSGGELFATVLMPGEWFGELSVIDGYGRTHDATSLESSELMVLPLNKLQRLITKHECIHYALVTLLCRKVRVAFGMIDDFLMCNPKERLAKRLINLSDSSDGGVKASQEELSQLVAISRQSASKFLKEWEDQGIIERRYGLIRVLDKQRLQLISD